MMRPTRWNKPSKASENNTKTHLIMSMLTRRKEREDTTTSHANGVIKLQSQSAKDILKLWKNSDLKWEQSGNPWDPPECNTEKKLELTGKPRQMLKRPNIKLPMPTKLKKLLIPRNLLTTIWLMLIIQRKITLLVSHSQWHTKTTPLMLPIKPNIPLPRNTENSSRNTEVADTTTRWERWEQWEWSTKDNWEKWEENTNTRWIRWEDITEKTWEKWEDITTKKRNLTINEIFENLILIYLNT